MNVIKNEFDRLTNNSGNFIFSSPTNGLQSENENYVSENPNSDLFGDGEYSEHYNFFHAKEFFKCIKVV